MNKILAPQWIAWIFATATAALTMTSFVYGTFPTQAAHDSDIQILNKRVDKLEHLVLEYQKLGNQRLQSVHQKVNQIYILLIKEKRR